MKRFIRKLQRWIRRESLTFQPQKVTPEVLWQIIQMREPLGLFYAREASHLYVGVDNGTGDAWTEDFRSLRRCKRWLLNPNLNAEGEEL